MFYSPLHRYWLWTPPIPFPVDTDNTITDDKAVDAVTDLSLPYNSYVKNVGICTVSPPYIFHDVVVKYRI